MAKLVLPGGGGQMAAAAREDEECLLSITRKCGFLNWRRGRTPLFHLLSHFPGDRDYGLSEERRHDRECPGDHGAREPEDDQALRPDG